MPNSDFMLGILFFILGLSALATLTTQRRMKKVDVRKISGSHDFDIVRLLSADFIKTIFIAILIALARSYFIVQERLARFANRVNLEWRLFAGSGVLTMAIASLTAPLQTGMASRKSNGVPIAVLSCTFLAGSYYPVVPMIVQKKL